MSENITWTIEKIKEGFDKFFKENGRLPTSPEIDKLDYLPSSRQIQRRFGGLEAIRKDLGYSDVNFGRGDFRKQNSFKVGLRGKNSEQELEKLLQEKFGEVFVHSEKPFFYGTNKIRVDFYIFCPDGNFGVDIFFTENIRDLQKNINIKLDKYGDFKDKLYFVLDGGLITQVDIDLYSDNKTKKMNDNMEIITKENFLEIIKNKNIYKDPTK